MNELFDRDAMLARMGTAATRFVTQRLFNLAYLPQTLVERLADEALTENWGKDLFVLKKYLAAHVCWAIEQSRFSCSDTQMFVAAGSLQTRYGTPLYLVFEKNLIPDRQPLALCHVGATISAPELPIPPEIPEPPEVPDGAEVVMMHDHILRDNEDRVAFLKDTPPVAQMCAVSGAIQWSLNRELAIPYYYFGRMNYVVPLYLQSRENITLAPDVIAPIEVTSESLLVRTVLAPHMPYASARVAVKRHDQLPSWMLDCWNSESATMSDDEDEEETPAVPVAEE